MGNSPKHAIMLNQMIWTKKSQSALEYMMTYGWAILIIVIVAVILYSMGIFNPSSSVTFTSSGFSPFIISSSLCNNIGLKIAVNTGPLPGSATSAKITAVYITSATGSTIQSKAYTLSNPITVTPGSVSTIIIPAVICSANGVKYTVSASLQYTTEGTPLPETLNSTGTIAGTAISGKPSVVTSYVPVTVTNTQSTATPAPFQQMINITSSDNGWSDISTSSFGQNVEFFYYNGSVIPSWLESYTSTNAIWWIKLGGIGGSSSKTIYMGFAPATTNLFNTVNDGEAPQLSSVYNSSNNMYNVFPLAFGFANSIPSFWNYNSITSPVNGVKGDNGLVFFVNSLTTENVYITSYNTVSNYDFGFTVSNYYNGSVLANFWDDSNTYQTGGIVVSADGDYLITNHANGNMPIIDNEGVQPTYLTISDIFFYEKVTMPSISIGVIQIS